MIEFEASFATFSTTDEETETPKVIFFFLPEVSQPSKS
jgi:hypothetical protein